VHALQSVRSKQGTPVGPSMPSGSASAAHAATFRGLRLILCDEVLEQAIGFRLPRASALRCRGSRRRPPFAFHDDYKEMASREARRKDGIEAVAIVTPNHLHYPIAREFLKRKIHVICDKPLTSTLADAKKLVKLVEGGDTLFILTHNYTGYPMVRHAREMVQRGELGEIRVVQVEYAQDWLAEPLEQTGQKQAAWRTDPEQSGAGGATGDIGTHAYNLAEFVTGLEAEALAADVHTFVEGRRLDDNAHVLLRFKGGAKGMLW